MCNKGTSNGITNTIIYNVPTTYGKTYTIPPSTASYTFTYSPRCDSCAHSKKKRCNECGHEKRYCEKLKIDVDDDFNCKHFLWCCTSTTSTSNGQFIITSTSPFVMGSETLFSYSLYSEAF